MREDRGLGVVGAGEQLLGTFPHDLREGESEGIVDGVEGVAGKRECVSEVLPQPDLLGTLAGTEDGDVHRFRTIEPQVKPAPKPTRRTVMPGLRRPESRASDSAR